MHQEAMTRSNQLYCTQNHRPVYFHIDFPADFECQQKSYKSALKNRRLEKICPMLIAFTSKKLSYFLFALPGTVIPFSSENVLKMMPKINSSVKMVS